MNWASIKRFITQTAAGMIYRGDQSPSHSMWHDKLIISEEADGFVVRLPQIGITGKGRTVQDAFDSFKSQFDETVEDFEAVGLEDALAAKVEPDQSPPAEVRADEPKTAGPVAGGSTIRLLRSRWEVRLAFVRTFFVVLLILVLIFAGLRTQIWLQDTGTQLARDFNSLVENLGVRKFSLRKLEKELINAAKPEHEIPANKLREIRDSLKILVARIKPMMDEIKPLFSDEPLFGGTVNVIDATYGGNCKIPKGNMTKMYKRKCDGLGQCRALVSVDEMGDPATGCGKDFVINWNCGDGTETRSNRLEPEAGLGGKSVTLSCWLKNSPTAAQ